MTLYICTAGTSIAAPPSRERPLTFSRRIEEKIRITAERVAGDPVGFLVGVSAETNGLTRSDCGSGDSVVLLASDTDDGMAAAEAVCRIVEEKLGAKARAVRVNGLQVRDLGAFRQEGVRNLLRAAVLEADAARKAGERVVFNVTGGFKGVVPYLTLLGMFEGIDVIYVYETSDALFRLPALPIRFDHERIAAAMPALQVLATRGVMPAEEYRRLLRAEGTAETGPLGLTEEDDGMVALSGAGELAWRGAIARTVPGRLFLHRRARQSGLTDHRLVRRALAHINDEPWRRIALHSTRNPKTDLTICKMRGSSAPHLFYWVDGDDVFVADVLPPAGEYERVLRGETVIRRSDFVGDQFEEIERPADDGDWYGDELVEFVADVDAERVALAERNTALDSELKDLRGRLRRAETRAGAAGASLTRLAAAAAFAAETHRGHRRKDADGTPYFHHLVEVVRLLAEDAGVADTDILVAAWLHDTIEDRQTDPDEIERRFGERVRGLVVAVTDDKSLDRDKRKDLQIAHAPMTHPDARLIKLADKIANLRDIMATPPVDWSPRRKLEYFEWAKQVVDGLRSGASHPHTRLEQLFDAVYADRLSAF